MKMLSKPWVARKDRGLFWLYPWLAWDGCYVQEFETWEEAIAYALSRCVDEW